MKLLTLFTINFILLSSLCFAVENEATLSYHIKCRKAPHALKIKFQKKSYYFEKAPIYSTKEFHIDAAWSLDGMASFVVDDYFLVPSEAAKKAIQNRLGKRNVVLLVMGAGKPLAVEKIKTVPERIKLDKAAYEQLNLEDAR